MSQPVFKNWFTPRGRRNRKSYILAEATLWGSVIFITLGAGLVVDSITESATHHRDIALFLLSFIVFSALFTIFYALLDTLLSAQRIRDIGYSGWWAVPLCISVIILGNFVLDESNRFLATLLLFSVKIILGIIPGNKGENKYGLDPLAVKPAKKRKKEK